MEAFLLKIYFLNRLLIDEKMQYNGIIDVHKIVEKIILLR
jgi:hypothetical protein